MIYDRQYSPLIFKQDGVLYVPAESVYAVFDVKHELRRTAILQAAEKAESVRRLKRTSVPVRYVRGTYKPKVHCLRSRPVSCAWKAGGVAADLWRSLDKVLTELSPARFINIGCAVRSGSFEAVRNRKRVRVEKSPPDAALIFFFLRLLYRLQQVGTVPAMDILKYAAGLKSTGKK